MPSTQNGWSTIPQSQAPLRKIPDSNVWLYLRKDVVGDVLFEVARLFDKYVEPIKDPGCWSWAPAKRIPGGSSYSNHSSGTAIDLNAPAHPWGARGTFSASELRELRRILAACKGVVRWGGDYRNKKDEMHFEIVTGSFRKLEDALRKLRAL